MTGTQNESSCSSNPESPNLANQEDILEGRAQYVSATCVVVTHYTGDVASVVDEHFTRALNFNNEKSNNKGEHNFNPMLLKYHCIGLPNWGLWI